MSKVRVGFIGVGGMAENHLKALKKLEQAEIAAIFDINAERARQIADTYGGECFESAESLIHSGKADALYVCTPPFARGNIEELAAAKGLHLFAEKPVGLDLAEARRKSRIIREAGIISSAGYCLRYLDTVQKAKAYMADKSPNLILSYRIGGTPAVSWWPLMDKSGGQLVEMATHQADLIRFIVGDEYREVSARYEQRSIREIRPDATIPDVGVVSFSMRSGAVGTISLTCMSKHMGRGDVEIFGSDFFVSISGKSLKIIDGNGTVNETSAVDFILEEDRAFMNAIQAGRQDLVLCSYEDAVKTLEMTLAANESAATGQSVAVTAEV